MVIDRLATKRQRSRIVCVAPEGDAAIRARIGGRVPSHCDESVTIPIRHLKTLSEPVKRREQKQLLHQPVIRNGGFKIHAVREDLPGHFATQDVPTQLQPLLWGLAVAEEQSSKHEAGGIGGIVVAVDIGFFQVTGGEITVQVERLQKALAKAGFRPSSAVLKHVKKPGPGEDAQGYFHGTGPVYGMGVRVGAYPMVQDVSCGLRISFVVGERIGLTERNHPLHARETSWTIG